MGQTVSEQQQGPIKTGTGECKMQEQIDASY